MRYAIYFTPPAAHPLTHAATAWLGYDAFAAASVPRRAVAGLRDAARTAFTAEPARYGFHGTLVAPFQLRPEKGAGDLRRAAEAFAAARTAFAIPRLAVRQIGPFFALVPADPLPALDALAAEAVDHFAPFRAPLTEAEIARRQPDRLSERQRLHLARHGYPYVKDEFRFHMTLTGPVADGEAAGVAAILASIFAPLTAGALAFDAVATFVEPAPGAAFRVADLHPLAVADNRKSA